MLVAGDGDVLVAICRRGVQVQHAERKRGGSGGHGTPAAIRATRRIQVHVPIILYTLCRALHGEFGLTSPRANQSIDIPDLTIFLEHSHIGLVCFRFWMKIIENHTQTPSLFFAYLNRHLSGKIDSLI